MPREGTSLTLGTTPPSGGGAPAPATYYFDGGLTISNGIKNVTLNPGIYYIRNGNLVISSGSSVTGNDVTFVLEGNAGYIFNGGATVNITAPTSNCVSPSAYPESAYENQASPYDGTDGDRHLRHRDLSGARGHNGRRRWTKVREARSTAPFTRPPHR